MFLPGLMEDQMDGDRKPGTPGEFTGFVIGWLPACLWAWPVTTLTPAGPSFPSLVPVCCSSAADCRGKRSGRRVHRLQFPSLTRLAVRPWASPSPLWTLVSSSEETELKDPGVPSRPTHLWSTVCLSVC